MQWPSIKMDDFNSFYGLISMNGDSKFHLVKWAKVCKPIQVGGLGIRLLRSFNTALLDKWLWRYGLEIDALWKRVIEAKYGNIWGGWCTKNVTNPYSVSLWKFIRSGWVNFSKLLWYDVGDGTRVKFWKHVQCGDCSLKEAFPKLYSLSSGLSRARILQWWKLWDGLVGNCIRIFIFVVHCKIGRKNLLIGSWTLFTLQKCKGWSW